MTISQIDPLLPTAPSRQRPATFSDEADAFLDVLEGTFQGDVNTMATEMNTTASEVDTNAQLALDSSLTSSAAANYKGYWNTLTGSLNIPASVYHSSTMWTLLSNLADVTAKEPGVDVEWTKTTAEILNMRVGSLVAGELVVANDAGTALKAASVSETVNVVTQAMFFSMGV